MLLDQQIKLIFILFMKYYIMLRLWYLVQQMLFENVWTINIYVLRINARIMWLYVVFSSGKLIWHIIFHFSVGILESKTSFY